MAKKIKGEENDLSINPVIDQKETQKKEIKQKIEDYLNGKTNLVKQDYELLLEYL